MPAGQQFTFMGSRRQPEKLIEPEGLKGEGPVAGFVPELAGIWHSIFDDRQNLRATLAGSGATAADSAMDAQAVAAAEIH